MKFNINYYLKYNFLKYIFEIYYKIIYSFTLLSFLIITCFLKIDSLLFFFAKYLLLNINTPKIFYSNIIEIFWIYFQISLFVAFFWGLPFIFFNFILFFLNGMFLNEYKFLLKTYFIFFFFYILFFFIIYLLKSQIFLVFFFFYILFFFIIYLYLVPHFLDFFLFFEKSNRYFPLYLEARFEDYFLIYLKIFFKFFFILNIPLFFLFFFNIFKIPLKNIQFIKKFNFYFILIFSLILSPPDLYSQIILIFFLFVFFEIFIFLFLLYKKIFFFNK